MTIAVKKHTKLDNKRLKSCSTLLDFSTLNQIFCPGLYKDVSEKHNDLHFQRYENVLHVFLRAGRDGEFEGKNIVKAKNIGFRVYDQGIVTYKQNKLGLAAYYDKRYVLIDGIHTRLLDF